MRNVVNIVCLLVVTAASGQQIEIAVQKGHSGDITAIAFNDDGTLLGSAGADHQVKLWHLPTGKEMASFSSTVMSRAAGIQFLHDSDFLEVVYEDGTLERWNIVTSTLIGASHSQIRRSHALFYAADSSYSLEVEKFYIKKKLPATGKTIFAKVPLDISKRFNAIAVSEAQKMILAANEDASVYAYDLDNGKSLGILEEHYGSVNAVCFSADSRFFATASSDRSIIIWNTETLRSLKRLFGKSFRYEALRFNHAGTQLAVGDELGYGRIINLPSTRIGVSVDRWHEQKISAIRFSAGDSLIYSAGFDNRLCVYNVRSQQLESKSIYKRYLSAGDFVLKTLGVYREPYAWINSLDVSASGASLAIGGAWRESAVRKSAEPLSLRALAAGVPSMTLRAHRGGVNDITFIDEQRLLSADDSLLVQWQYDTRRRQMFFRQKIVKGIRKILPGPGSTVVLQKKAALVHYDVIDERALDSIETEEEITAATVNPHSGRVVYAFANSLVFTNLSSWHQAGTTISRAHGDRITSIDYNPTRPMVATCSWDATVKLWDAETAKLLATIISVGSDDHLIITPDNYYYGTKSALNAIGFKYGKQFISPEQYDLRFNRPDIILQRLGFVPEQIVRAFHRAYLKRLQKMGFTEEMLGEEIHMPVLALDPKSIPINATTDELSFSVTAKDAKYNLDRINVFVNNIPVYGLNGISLRDRSGPEVSQAINVKLSAGRNKVQVSCLNEKGVESLMQTAEIVYHAPAPIRPDLYLAVISVSKYTRESMNLKYARKDGEDIADLFKRSGWYKNIYIDTLFDESAVLSNIKRLRDFFRKAGVEDEVICFVSGHGLLDENLDFYFATHDIDFKEPASKGLRYEDLEGLLDGINARKKLLLIDACHSGEVDKTRLQAGGVTAGLTQNKKGTVTAYTYPPDIESEHYKVGVTTSFELMQEVFANVSKGSGAIVISAAAGNSYALESDEWRNGVFTFSVLSGLKDRLADGNRDRAVTVAELKDFVSREVEELTKGAQRPTSRSENLEFDFRVW